MSNVLDSKVSWFNRWTETGNPRGPIKLGYWLTHRSAEYDRQVDRIRSTTDEKQRKDLKNQLPGITPHGQFSYRNSTPENLIAHSGFLCIDLDEKDNRHLADFGQMKTHMSQLPEVAYCGLSVSGNGYFVLIPIAYPERHSEQFDALIELFADMNIRVDTSGRNVDRFRFYSYDPSPYLNPNATRFTGLPRPKPVVVIKHRRFDSTSPTDEGALLTRLANMVRNAPDGAKHRELLKAAKLAGGLVAGGQLTERIAVDVLETEISNRPDVANLNAAFKTIKAGMLYGFNEPIYATEKPVSGPFLPTVTDTRPRIVTRLSDWKLDTILRPDESQLERLSVEKCETYPLEWDDPPAPNAIPVLRVQSAAEWLASLPI